MKWWFLGVVVALFLSSSLSSASEPAVKSARKKPFWFSDYEKARASARETGQPLFVVFR